MEHLRWILILIGAVLLIGIVLFANPERERRRPQRRRKRREPRIAPAGETRADAESASDDAPATGDRSGAREASAGAADQPQAAGAPNADKIVYLYLVARGDRRIAGVELLDAAIKAGLDFGEQQIFHRLQEGDERPVFSMANLVNPGTFEPSEWNLFETSGVTLFMTLPGPLTALQAWDAMLATSERLARLLELDVLDDSRCRLTRQRIAQIREEMRGYDRRQGLTSRR